MRSAIFNTFLISVLRPLLRQLNYKLELMHINISCANVPTRVGEETRKTNKMRFNALRTNAQISYMYSLSQETTMKLHIYFVYFILHIILQFNCFY